MKVTIIVTGLIVEFSELIKSNRVEKKTQLKNVKRCSGSVTILFKCSLNLHLETSRLFILSNIKDSFLFNIIKITDSPIHRCSPEHATQAQATQPRRIRCNIKTIVGHTHVIDTSPIITFVTNNVIGNNRNENIIGKLSKQCFLHYLYTICYYSPYISPCKYFRLEHLIGTG